MFYSALLLLGNSYIVHLVGTFFDPQFNLLASRGLNKIIFTTLVALHLIGFVFTQSKKFLQNSYQVTAAFLWRDRWFGIFSKMFGLFFSLHAMFVIVLCSFGYFAYDISAFSLVSPMTIAIILYGFFVAFMLAWTEEAIFRGIIFRYILQYCQPLVSVFIASLIFMLAHDLLAPWHLISSQWQLGLGLFLLGFLLNLIFLISGKLYIGMGAHAGIVGVKVVLRKIPLLLPLESVNLPWYLHTDLRQCHVTHLLFGAVILILLIMYRKQKTVPQLFDKNRNS